MTAETLKPFITTTSDNFPATHANTKMSRRERHSNLLVISVSVAALVLATILLGLTIWNSIRVNNLEAEVKSLNRVVESMQKRLGLNYLDDLQDFEKEYQNALIDNPSTLDDVVDDDDEDEEEDEDDEEDAEDSIITEDEYDEIENYDEIVKKYNSYDDSDEDDDESESESRNLSDNDNLYDDFEKFKDSRKKKESSRKSRSIAHAPNKLHEVTNKTEDAAEVQKDTSSSGQLHHRSHKPALSSTNLDTLGSNGANQKLSFVSQRIDDRRSPLRPRSQRKRHKVPTIKSGESLLSAKSTGQMSAVPYKAAAHYHLNQKIPDRHTTLKVDSYTGDMYIGHSSWSNELVTEPYFQVIHGVLTVREAGLYYIYAQVCYNNTHDQNGFVIFHGHKPFLQCLNTVPTNMPLKIHTCHTSGLIYLQASETIHLRDFHSDRNVILKNANNRSYFGIMKI